MSNSKNADVSDQIKTAFLDILRIEELKVCTPILKDQLQKSGFKKTKIKLMKEKNKSLDYKTIGWHFIEARQ